MSPTATRAHRTAVQGFVGGFGAVAARQVNSEGTWNGLVEGVTGTGKTGAYLRKGPGVRPFATVNGAASVRGLFSQDDRAFVIAGTQFYEFDADGNLFHGQTILEDSNPATFACNGANGFGGGTAPQAVTSITRVGSVATVTTTGSHGFSTGWVVIIADADQADYDGNFKITVTGATTFTYAVANFPVTPATGTITAAGAIGGPQLLALSGGTGLCYDMVTNTQQPISAPGLELPYSMAIYIDGYGIVLKANSPQFNFSHLQDFSQFDALDFAARSEGSDNLAAIVASHRNAWLLGTRTSEVWQDDGVTPFSPIPSVFLEVGCVAPFSALAIDNAVVWLGRDVNGHGIVYKSNGYTPERLSNFSVEYWLSRSSDLSAAIAFSMQFGGHLLYLLYVPDLPWTWVYDFSSQVWTVFTQWDSTRGVDVPWFGRCHCFAFGRHLIGDRSSGTIYEVSLDLVDNEVAA